MFKNKKDKEIEKKLLMKRTINSMNKQIEALEEQKKNFLEKAKEAQKNGLETQYNFALTGYKMTLMQQKRAQEMLLNFEITTQMKDMTMMTKVFLGAMSDLSKEMAKIMDDKEFIKVQKEFENAMDVAERQALQLDGFLESNRDAFSSARSTESINDGELREMIEKQNAMEEDLGDSIDQELEKIQMQLNEELK